MTNTPKKTSTTAPLKTGSESYFVLIKREAGYAVGVFDIKKECDRKLIREFNERVRFKKYREKEIKEGAMAEITNEKQYEISLDLMCQCTESINAMIEEFRNSGFTSEEIRNCIEPQLAFREGVIFEILDYRKKKEGK